MHVPHQQISCLLILGAGLATAAFVPRNHNYYDASGSIGIATKPITPSGTASITLLPTTVTVPTTKPTAVKTPPYSNYTIATGKPIYPRGATKPTYIPRGTGISILPTGTGISISKPPVYPSNTRTLRPSPSPQTSVSTTSPTTPTHPTTSPTPSTFFLKNTPPSPSLPASYLSLQPDPANGEDALQLLPSLSSATAFTLNPDGTLQSGGTFAGVYADVTETPLLMQTGVLEGGSFVKSVCEIGGAGELTCTTGRNGRFYTCGDRFVDIGVDGVSDGVSDGSDCVGFGLEVVPV
ncbi:hypothetical protein ACLMJK_001066 [Lecanora helva]